MQVEYVDPIPIMVDNTRVISISKNLVLHSKPKHFPRKYHFPWDLVANHVVKLEIVATSEKISNSFTKPPPRGHFEHLR